MKRISVALAQRVGRRGSCLLFFAILDLLYGFSLAMPPSEAEQSAAVKFIQYVAPLPVWSVTWVLVGLICLVGAFMIVDRWAFAFAMALKMLWGMTFLLGWAIAGLERGWVSAAIWLPMAAWILILSGWREYPFFNRVLEQR